MGRRFVAERRRDPYYRAAKREGLRSRAAFKLEFLDQRFHLLRPGLRILDLGAAPGGWSLIAAHAVGPTGHVVAVDERSLEAIEGVRFVRGRVGDPQLVDRLAGPRFDLILSDLSPRISGAYATDHARSVELAREALRLTDHVLKVGGSFVAKVFDGEMLSDLEREASLSFERVRRTKPPASRGASSELYVVALGHRGRAAPQVALAGSRGSDI